MNDPDRLSETEGTDAEIAFLLRAARLHAAPAAGKGRLLAAMGILAGATTVASTGTAAAVATGGAALAGKWIAIVAIGAAVAFGGVEASRAVSARRPSGAVAAVRVTAGARPSRSFEAPGVSAPIVTPSVASTPFAESRAVAPPPLAATGLAMAPTMATHAPNPHLPDHSTPLASAGESTVSAELSAIDLARRALARGEPAASLATLDAYDRRFDHPYFAQEATVLRVEALLRIDDLDGARKVGERLLQSEPESPYAQRIRSLLRGKATPANL